MSEPTVTVWEVVAPSHGSRYLYATEELAHTAARGLLKMQGVFETEIEMNTDLPDTTYFVVRVAGKIKPNLNAYVRERTVWNEA